MPANVAGAVPAATGRLGPIRYLDFTALRVAGTALAIIGIGMVAAAQSGMVTAAQSGVVAAAQSGMVTAAQSGMVTAAQSGMVAAA